jgi:hypothetical protein
VRLNIVAAPVDLAASQAFGEPTVEVFQIRIGGVEDGLQTFQLCGLDLGPLRDFPLDNPKKMVRDFGLEPPVGRAFAYRILSKKRRNGAE